MSLRDIPKRQCSCKVKRVEGPTEKVTFNGKTYEIPLETYAEAEPRVFDLGDWNVETIQEADDDNEDLKMKEKAGIVRMCIKVADEGGRWTYMHLDAFACCILLCLDLKGQTPQHRKWWKEAFEHVKPILDKEQEDWCVIAGKEEAKRPVVGGLSVPGYPKLEAPHREEFGLLQQAPSFDAKKASSEKKRKLASEKIVMPEERLVTLIRASQALEHGPTEHEQQCCDALLMLSTAAQAMGMVPNNDNDTSRRVKRMAARISQ
jgi:hypothetical protein